MENAVASLVAFNSIHIIQHPARKETESDNPSLGIVEES
jgi:hypothetical protein